MAENSGIEWTTHTFNPWRGCAKIAPGCANCYADTMSKRSPRTLGIWGPNGTRVVASEAMWREPVKWNREAACNIRFDATSTRPRVFCASLADVFEDWQSPMQDASGLVVGACDRCGKWGRDAENSWSSCCAHRLNPVTIDDVRARLFALIDATPNLDWLLLTKRPENIRRMWPRRCDCKVKPGDIHSALCRIRSGNLSDHYRPNVWLGTSVATQEDAEQNIPHLLNCRDLSPVLFVSAEPLLGDLGEDFIKRVKCPRCEDGMVDITGDGGLDFFGPRCTLCNGKGWGIDWLIVGGESGPNARPMHPSWVRSLRDQCAAAGVPFLMKQWGEWAEASQVEGGVDCMAKIQAIHPSGKLYKNSDTVPHGEGVAVIHRVGKKAAGRTLDGQIHDGYPKGGA